MRAVYTITISIVLLNPVSVPAASVFFDTSAGFLSAAGALDFDSVEDLVISGGPVAMLSRPGFALTSDVSGTAPGGGYGIYAFHSASAFGAFATDGTTYIVHQSDVAGTLRFDFAAPVTAVSFSITDWESPTGVDAELIASNDLGEQYTIASGALPNGNELFFGIVSDTPFSSLELLSTSPREAYGIDSIYYTSTVVPVPGAFLLMISGLLALVSVSRLQSVLHNQTQLFGL